MLMGWRVRAAAVLRRSAACKFMAQLVCRDRAVFASRKPIRAAVVATNLTLCWLLLMRQSTKFELAKSEPCVGRRSLLAIPYSLLGLVFAC